MMALHMEPPSKQTLVLPCFSRARNWVRFVIVGMYAVADYNSPGIIRQHNARVLVY